jgi:outer membrane lipoprotein-sorting protein
MSRAFVVCALLLVWCASQPAAVADAVNATPPSTAPAAMPGEIQSQLEQIDARGAQIKDLAAHFAQAKRTTLLKKPLESSGTVIVKGPRVRWTVAKPHESVMVTNPNELRIYYPEQKTLEIYDLDQRIGDLAASPLPRLAILLKHFRIEPAPATQPHDDSPGARLIWLVLTPTDPMLRDHVAEVRVGLDTKLAVAVSVTIIDPNGDRTDINFSQIKIDSGIEDGSLELKGPPDTTIVRPLEKLR